MPIITSELITVKGAIFLSKSAAVKAAIVKYGTTKTIAETVSVGMTVATAPGYFVVIKSIPTNSVKGFT